MDTETVHTLTDQSTDYEYYVYYYDEIYAHTNISQSELELEIYDFEPVLLGCIRAILILVSVMANVFVTTYFMSKRRIRKASNLLFTSIALSDTMTGVVLLPNSFAIYAPRKTLLSEEWCEAYMILRLLVCQVFHTVSVWQTLLLGIQRYVCVCHPFIFARVCTFSKTFLSIILMYIIAFLLHMQYLFRPLSDPPYCRYAHEIPCNEFCTYMWLKALFQNLMPCVMLVFLTSKTVWTLKGAHQIASTIIYSRTASRTSKERVLTTTTSLIVVCFLIPELPYGIYQVILVFHLNDIGGLHLTQKLNHIVIAVYEIVLIVSFHANFWIYCAMMYKFRRTLMNLFRFGTLKPRLNRIQTSFKATFRRRRTSSLTSRNRILSRTTSLPSTTSDRESSIRLAAIATKENVRNEDPSNSEKSKPNEADVFV